VSESSQFRLLSERRFLPFFGTQFAGALNDNIFRNALVILVTFQSVRVAGMDYRELANLSAALFILPYFLFSATAGQLADKYEKSMLMRRIKVVEIALMLAATIAFLSGAYAVLLVVLFLMGLQSTLFGPVKYAYLPQQLSTSELVGGNALVEAGTYTAIILGLIIGGLVVAVSPDNQLLLGTTLVAVALAGYVCSRRIPTTAAADPALHIERNIAVETWRIIRYARRDRTVFLSILGISWFWAFGSAMVAQVPAYTLDFLNGDEAVATTLLVAFAVGVGIGSLLCEKLSGHRIELGLVPFGSIGMTVFAVDLYFAQPDANGMLVAGTAAFLERAGSWRVLADLALLGAFGGIYSVPLYAMIQKRADRRYLSRIIAANNIINAVLMVAAAVFAIALLNAGLSIPGLFLVLAGINALVAIYIYALLPEFLMRFMAWLLIAIFYRVRPRGIENIPDSGPAVIVCNHVSYIDPILLAGCVRRPMRFVMYYRIFDMPLLKWFFRQAKAIPIASAREDETLMNEAFDKVDAELAAGNLVCIFPEGALTPDGEIQRFRPGIERVIARRPVPVVPVALGRMWGGWFSRSGRGGRLRLLPRRLFARVPVTIGEPVASTRVSAAGLEMLVRTLRGDRR